MNDIMETLASESASSSSSDSQNQRTVFAYCDAEILEDSAETYGVTLCQHSRLSGGESGEDDRRRGRWAVSASGEYVLLFFCEGKRKVRRRKTSGTTVMKATSNKETENVKPDGGGKETEEELQKRLIHLTTVQPVVLFMIVDSSVSSTCCSEKIERGIDKRWNNVRNVRYFVRRERSTRFESIFRLADVSAAIFER